MKRALISLSDKSGVVEFAKGLVEHDFEIISTGGTKKMLDEAGIKTIAVEEVTPKSDADFHTSIWSFFTQ